MFVQVVGEGQEYRGRIFPRSICFVMATVFVVLHLWSTSSLCVMQFWKEIHSEFTVKALKGQNSAFLQVKFIEFLSVNVNASRVCDIRYKINDFIVFLLLHFSKFDIEWLCPDAFNYFCYGQYKHRLQCMNTCRCETHIVLYKVDIMNVSFLSSSFVFNQRCLSQIRNKLCMCRTLMPLHVELNCKGF